MSVHRDIDDAVLALFKRGLPQYDVSGLADGAERPRRISPFGSVIVRDGDAGDPEIDLSPPTYHYERRIPIDLGAYLSSEPLRVVLDRMGGEIGAVIAGDRFLGGLVSYLDATAIDIAPLTIAGGTTQLGGTFYLVAIYSTTSPL